MNRSFVALACVGAFFLAPLAVAGPGEGRAGRHGQRHGQRHGMARGLRALELTDAQKAQWREARAAAEPVREDLRTQMVALRQARKAAEDTAEARDAFRAKRKATVEAALAAVAPSASRMIASLTPEQRAKLEERAKAHGRTLDDAKLLRRFEHLLLARRGMRHGGEGRDAAPCTPTTPATPTTPTAPTPIPTEK